MPLTEQQLQQIRDLIQHEFKDLLVSDRFTFQKNIQIFDGRNIQLASNTGTKIGTSTTEKLGFFNATPVVQVNPTGASGHTAVGGTNVDSDDHFTGGVGSSIWAIGDIVRALKLLGLIQS